MQAENPHTPDIYNPSPAPAGGWKRRAVIGGLVVALAGGAGIAAVSAGPDGFGPGAIMKVRGGGWHGGWHGGFAGGMDHVLDEIEVTDEQRDRIWAIVDEARSTLWPMAREMRSTREEVAELLGAETIDREAVEALRSDRVASIDEATKAMTTALMDAAEVLTPEQRTKLLEHLEERRSHRRW